MKSEAESQGTCDSADIPLEHRLAILYLMLPVVVWLVGWFAWWLGIPAALLLALGLWPVLKPARLNRNWQAFFDTLRRAARPTTIALLLVAFAWVMATAAGGVFDVGNFDWIKHRAIFLDLSRGAWPVFLPTWVTDLAVFLPEGETPPGHLLRYYLGFYIVPGLIGKALGAGALNWAVPLWTWCGVALIVLIFSRGYLGWKAVAAAAILLFFSGIDIVTVALFEGLAWFDVNVSMERWPRIGLGRNLLERNLSEDIKVLYLSHVANMQWAPQHFIGGALYVLLLMQLRRNARFLAVSGIVVGASVFWSPFIAIGLLPFVAVMLFENRFRPFLRWQNLILAVPLFALLMGYLTAGTADIPRLWLWEIFEWRLIARMLPVLYVTEFLLLAVLLSFVRPQLWRDGFFVVSLATLLLLPLYYYGLHNDLVMRGLIPSLLLLSYFCAQAILGRQRSEAKEGSNGRTAVFTGLLIATLGIGALGPVLSMVHANNNRDLGVLRYNQLGLGYSSAEAVGQPIVSQYLVEHVPGWYRALLRESAKTTTPVQSELLISSEFDVYLLDGEVLVYTKTPCTSEDVEAQFILFVFPLEDLGNVQRTLDFSFASGAGFTIGETCVASRALPNFAFSHIRAGQYTPDRSGHIWVGNYYSEEFRHRVLSEAGEPVVRSRFDVYISHGQLLYHKAMCSDDDIAAPFFYQVTPVDVADLPADRRQAGFQRIEFGFAEHGGRIGESCLIVRDLPDYEIVRIRSGQQVSGDAPVWEGEFSPQ